MEATTMRASTVTRSIPTSETRTHASITIPLSRTRSSTSMRELPLGERSTAIAAYSVVGERVLLLSASGSARLCRELLEAAFDPFQPPLDLASKKRTRRYRGESWVMPPPVQSDLLGLVDGAHEQAHLNREELNVCEVDLDVASDHQPLVEDAVEDLDQSMTARRCYEIRQAGTLRRCKLRPLLA